MKQDIGISIFYSENLWHNLINECLSPFLELINTRSSSIIMLSRFRGDQIRLFVACDKSDSKEIARMADSYVGNYLKTHKAPFKSSLVPNKGIFSDFANNSIHYGIFDLFESEDVRNKNFQFLRQVSSTLLEIFGYYREKTLNMLDLLISQLLITLINSTSLTTVEKKIVLDNLLISEHKKNSQTKRNLLDNVTDKIINKEYYNLLFELKDFQGDDIKANTHKWLNNWKMNMETYTYDFGNNSSTDNLIEDLILKINIILNSFNVNNRQEIYRNIKSRLYV